LKGMIEKMGGALDAWTGYVTEEGLLSGKGVEGGHYIPEERPDDVLQEILTFML
jgi:haloacetate dehalogenase